MTRKIKLIPSIVTLGLLGAVGAHAEVPAWLVGDPVPVSAAARTVEIGADTSAVNVHLGETVAFVVNGQSFAFDFDGPHSTAIDLQRIAPIGALDHRVMVYVGPGADDGRSYGGRGR